jgi:flagellar motility protein MotE (MotC chaperone)
MKGNKKRAILFLLGMILTIKLTISLLPIFSYSGRSETKLNNAEASGEGISSKEGPKENIANQKEEDGKKNSMDPVKWLDVLKKKELELRNKEEAILLEEERLKALKKEIEEKISRLDRTLERLKALMEQKEKKDGERVRQLVKILESTPPEQTAKILEKMDIRTSAYILSFMNGKKAGRVLGFLSPNQAIKISEELSGIKER